MGSDRADHRIGDSHGRVAESLSAPDAGVGRADGRSGTRQRAAGDQGELMLSSFNAVVPMACVTAAALAAMTAEAFRAPGERIPIAPLGVIGLAGAALASALLWNRN